MAAIRTETSGQLSARSGLAPGDPGFPPVDDFVLVWRARRLLYE
jgi:hypothetical protein